MRAMKRALVIGWLLGLLTFAIGASLAGSWYEYRWESSAMSTRDRINDEGWEVVPGQPNERYLRRPRLRVH